MRNGRGRVAVSLVLVAFVPALPWPVARADDQDVAAVATWLGTGYAEGERVEAVVNRVAPSGPGVEMLVIDFERLAGAIALRGRTLPGAGALAPPRKRPRVPENVLDSGQVWIGVFKGGETVYLAPVGAPFVRVSERPTGRNRRWRASVDEKRRGRLTVHLPRVADASIAIFKTNSVTRSVVAAELLRDEGIPGSDGTVADLALKEDAW